MIQLPTPTPDQCESGEIIEHHGKRYLATWYPEIGGHGGMCWVDLSRDGDCIDIVIWYAKDFPFSARYQPTVLHNCDGLAKFIRFGELVQKAKESSK